MASSSSYCFIFASLAILLPFLSLSASATKYIDGICQNLFSYKDKAFCYKTLNAYHPAASATSQLKASEAATHLALSYANKYFASVEKVAKENPKLRKQFVDCLNAFSYIPYLLKGALKELGKSSPALAANNAKLCIDQTTKIYNLIGKNTDEASKRIIKITMIMKKYISISGGAAVVLGG